MVSSFLVWKYFTCKSPATATTRPDRQTVSRRPLSTLFNIIIRFNYRSIYFGVKQTVHYKKFTVPIIKQSTLWRGGSRQRGELSVQSFSQRSCYKYIVYAYHNIIFFGKLCELCWRWRRHFEWLDKVYLLNCKYYVLHNFPTEVRLNNIIIIIKILHYTAWTHYMTD